MIGFVSHNPFLFSAICNYVFIDKILKGFGDVKAG